MNASNTTEAPSESLVDHQLPKKSFPSYHYAVMMSKRLLSARRGMLCDNGVMAYAAQNMKRKVGVEIYRYPDAQEKIHVAISISKQTARKRQLFKDELQKFRDKFKDSPTFLWKESIHYKEDDTLTFFFIEMGTIEPCRIKTFISPEGERRFAMTPIF